jgi:hypothetical protein
MNNLIGKWGDTTSGFFLLSFAHGLKKLFWLLQWGLVSRNPK